MLLATHAVIFVSYIWMHKRCFCKDLQVKVKKLNHSNYKIYMVKIHYSQKIGYVHSHKNASIILKFIKPNK